MQKHPLLILCWWCGWSALISPAPTHLLATAFPLSSVQNTHGRAPVGWNRRSLHGRHAHVEVCRSESSGNVDTAPPDDSSKSRDDGSDSADCWLSLDPNDMSVGERYGFFISAIVPRPVAVITTKSADGVVNCAPFSYTSLSSHDPPIVTHGIAVTGGGRKKKDTLQNIEETGEWVFHVLTQSYLTEANACAASLPPDQDETSVVGLVTLPSDQVQVPRLEQAAVALECRLWDKRRYLTTKEPIRQPLSWDASFESMSTRVF